MSEGPACRNRLDDWFRKSPPTSLMIADCSCSHTTTSRLRSPESRCQRSLRRGETLRPSPRPRPHRESGSRPVLRDGSAFRRSGTVLHARDDSRAGGCEGCGCGPGDNQGAPCRSSPGPGLGGGRDVVARRGHPAGVRGGDGPRWVLPGALDTLSECAIHALTHCPPSCADAASRRQRN